MSDLLDNDLHFIEVYQFTDIQGFYENRKSPLKVVVDNKYGVSKVV
jgi:hypothetical protein